MSNSPPSDADTPPPPAPPLPPTLPANPNLSPAKNALTRIAVRAGRSLRPSSTREQNPHGSSQPGLNDAGGSKSLAVTRNVTHKTGIPIASLDRSPSHTHAVLAGRDILRIIKVTDHLTFTGFTEVQNLRTAITNYAATYETTNGQASPRHRDQLAASDVKWSHDSFDKKIATATASGQIMVYDIDRIGLVWARLHEHDRQVHKLGFNPFGGHLMLSGSQDATIRMWDLRDFAGNRSVMAILSRKKFPGNSDAVRDLRWSPINAMEFAAATDSGVIQRWDIRKQNVPLLKIAAHEKTCQSVDWHPDGKHIVSAGRDKNVKVWDFSSSDRRMKALWQLRAPQAVMHARWRPACWHVGDNQPGRWQSVQLATSFDKEDPRTLIWDFRRPSVPFRVFNRHDDPPSDLFWHSENLLWSVGSHGMFTQTDIRTLPKRSPKLRGTAFAWAPDGSLLVASRPRQLRRSSLDDVNDGLLLQQPRQGSAISGSNSAGAGSPEDCSPPKSSVTNRRSRPRASASMDITPPTAGSIEPITSLDMSLTSQSIYKSDQVLNFVKVPGVFDLDAFKFMAIHYKAPLPLPGDKGQASKLGNKLHLILSETFQHNARVAAHAGQFRMAQTWDMMALAAEKELKKRAENNYQQRRFAAAARAVNNRSTSPPSSEKRYHGQNPSHLLSPGSDKGTLRAQAKAPPAVDTSSDTTLPLAKPFSETSSVSSGCTVMPEVHHLDQLQLPAASFPKQDPKLAKDISALCQLANADVKEKPWYDGRSKSPSNDECLPFRTKQLGPNTTQFAGVDCDMAQQVTAAQNYRGVPRPILAYDSSVQMKGLASNAPPAVREDSEESFQFFPSSNESSQKTDSDLSSVKSSYGSRGAKSRPEQYNTFTQHGSRNQRRDSGDVFSYQHQEKLDKDNSKIRGLEYLDSFEGPHSDFPLGIKRTTLGPRSTASFRPVRHPPARVCYEDMEPLGEDPHPKVYQNTIDNEYIFSDYDRPVPLDTDPPPLPWSLTAMLGPLIKYHVESLKDLLFPTYCWLHICPYFNTVDELYNMHIVRLNLIHQHHERLRTHGLYVEACELRNYAGKDYIELVERVCHGMENGGPWCTTCNKPNKGTKAGYCERCRKAWAPCPICLGTGPIIQPRTVGVDTVGARAVIYPAASDRLMTWCQQCGHGGHVGCMTEFWKDEEASEGACPVIGCSCDCMPGIRRDEINRQILEEEEKKKGPVRPDNWFTGESAAVRGARELTGRRGILQRGGRGRGDNEGGGKKVRIVEPHDEEGEQSRVKGKQKTP